MHFLPTPFTRVDAEALIAGTGDGRDAFWGVRLRDTTTLVGTVGSHLVYRAATRDLVTFPQRF